MADEPEGAAATAEPAASTEPASTTEPAQDVLGDAGKAAIAAERKRASTAERALKAAQTQLDKLAEANQSEAEKAISQARKEAAEAATAEVTTAFRSKLLNAEIRARAAGKFANPDLAVKVLDFDLDDVFDGDEMKVDSITKAIDDFLALDENRGLKADPSNGRPTGSADAGVGSGSVATPEQAHQQFIAGVLRGHSPTR